MRTFGIDVSHWEGRIGWRQAAPAIGFAYYKCTDGTRFVDAQFENNRSGCSEEGIPHAPYHYFQPSLDPRKQAEHFITIAGKENKRYILDVEAPERVANITGKLLAFLERAEELTGIRPAIYTSAGYWNDFIRPRPAWAGGYDLIVAHYTAARTPILPVGWSTYVIWQFSDYWNLPGCRENLDANWFNGDLDACRGWFGNFRPLEHPPQPHPGEGLKMRSLFDNLHIRQSPNVHAHISGNLARGEAVEVEQISGDDAWIRHARGWSAVERGDYRYMEVIR